jgi:hypothetical protein
MALAHGRRVLLFLKKQKYRKLTEYLYLRP